MRSHLLTTLLLTLLLAPLAVFAQDQGFVPLVGIPFLDESKMLAPGIDGYVNSLYKAAIIIAAVLAVGRIVIAGVQYMLTDIATKKGDAKRSIRGAIIGLILVVSAVLILETINPSLKSLDALSFDNISVNQNQTTVTLPSPSSIEDEANARFPDGWKVVECNFLRIRPTCKGSCEAKGGIFIRKGISFEAISYVTSQAGIIDSISNEGSHQCIVSKNDNELATEEAQLESESVTTSDINSDETKRRCSIQGRHPLACNIETESCRNGGMLPDGRRGIPTMLTSRDNITYVDCR